MAEIADNLFYACQAVRVLTTANDQRLFRSMRQTPGYDTWAKNFQSQFRRAGDPPYQPETSASRNAELNELEKDPGFIEAMKKYIPDYKPGKERNLYCERFQPNGSKKQIISGFADGP